MMDLSKEIENLLKTIKVLTKDSEEHIKISRPSNYLQTSTTSIADDIIDVTQIDFSDDETWLYKSEGEPSGVDIVAWLHEDSEVIKDLDFHTKHLTLMREITKLNDTKKIDSRTFTRPKKRFSRPSLDLNDSRFKISDIMYNKTHNNNSTSEEKCKEHTVISSENKLSEQVPLNFDLSEPINILNNIIGNTNLDSFQNMSPPSLVSSSMFSSIMENSYIKNDPVLREIRDTDYTDVILQGCDPSLLKSFTGSCSSVDSDTPEGFLKRSVETTFIRNDNAISTDTSTENILNDTFDANTTVILNTYPNESSANQLGSPTCSPNKREEHLSAPKNATNRSSSILNNTFTKNTSDNFNDTFTVVTHNQNERINNDNLNETVTIINENNIDSNRLNYTKRFSCIIEDSKSDIKFNTFSKRNSTGCSLGSNDSLDYASSLSNSSSGKGSSKMLNMAEVDAIVLQQEQSLQQVMSTPKPSAKTGATFRDYNNISPIKQFEQPDHFSDSEASSNDDYLTVGSGSTKSVTSGCSDPFVLSPKNVNNIPKQIPPMALKNVEMAKKPPINKNLHYGSYTNLHKAKVMAQVKQNPPVPKNGPKTTQSNLKTMDVRLKSSYTQLKPVFTNLPSATTNSLKAVTNNASGMKIPETISKAPQVVPIVREQAKSVLNKPSGLPRPVSGIPRPTTSRIPGLPLRSGIPLSRPESKSNIDMDF